MKERRLVRVAIYNEFLLEWLTQGHEITLVKTTRGLPPDATFISSQFDDRTLTAFLIFEHESFAPVLVGSEIPYFDIQFTRYELAERIQNA